MKNVIEKLEIYWARIKDLNDKENKRKRPLLLLQLWKKNMTERVDKG